MAQNIIIRNERESDREAVENLTRKAFYNLYMPGCVEHYLVQLLMEHSFQKAVQLGYDVIVIFGSLANYVSRGFKSCRTYNVSAENGKYPSAMMVKELIPNVLANHRWIYQDSPVMAVREEDALRYDDTLEPMEKKYLPSQDEFFIMSHSFIEE